MNLINLSYELAFTTEKMLQRSSWESLTMEQSLIFIGSFKYYCIPTYYFLKSLQYSSIHITSYGDSWYCQPRKYRIKKANWLPELHYDVVNWALDTSLSYRVLSYLATYLSDTSRKMKKHSSFEVKALCPRKRTPSSSINLRSMTWMSISCAIGGGLCRFPMW